MGRGHNIAEELSLKNDLMLFVFANLTASGIPYRLLWDVWFAIIFMGLWIAGEKISPRDRQLFEENVLVVQEIFSRSGKNFRVLSCATKV